MAYRTAGRGQKFGRLKVVDWSERPDWWICLCECGNHREVTERRLLSGEITECVACEVKLKMEARG